MIGWEFPPFYSGGLGIAISGLTKSLAKQDAEITLICPKAPNTKTHVNLIGADTFEEEYLKDEGNTIKIRKILSLLRPYVNSSQYFSYYNKLKEDNGLYGSNLHEEVERFAEIASMIAREQDFDVIHAHDWMTYPAAVKIKKESKKPLVLHIHNTVFDRYAGGSDDFEYGLERYGFLEADEVIAISNYVKSMIIEKYMIDPAKITVVHNGIELAENENIPDECFKIKEHDQIVLSLGRITIQKGIDYLIYAAKKVVERKKNVKFVIAGSGDMMPWVIDKVAELGLSRNFLFTGWLARQDIDRAYKMADLFVMPSVSEPFGLVALEAMRNSTPVLISKQSGVSEVVEHALKVDFWDIDEMANKILGVLNYSAAAKCLSENSYGEVALLGWDEPARKCMEVYKGVCSLKQNCRP